MGFKPGTEITLDNALKILMVKSANDVAITVAEGIGGSVEDFAVMMNRAAARLGMTQSHFVNPNGLFDPAHVSSARDMAILARALYMDFPQQAGLYSIGALRLGEKIIPTHNGLIGRYPGADGMKTGFVCPSGFNVVASAQRGGRHLVVVVMGSPNAKLRTLKAAHLLDGGFAGGTPWRAKTLSTLPALPGPPPNMRAEICGKHRKVVQEDDLAVVPAPSQADDSAAAFFASDGRAPAAANLLAGPRPVFEPIEIFVRPPPRLDGTRPAGARNVAARQRSGERRRLRRPGPETPARRPGPVAIRPPARPAQHDARRRRNRDPRHRGQEPLRGEGARQSREASRGRAPAPRPSGGEDEAKAAWRRSRTPRRARKRPRA